MICISLSVLPILFEKLLEEIPDCSTVVVLQEAAERKKEEEEDAAEKAAEAEDTWGKLGDAVSNLFGAGM